MAHYNHKLVKTLRSYTVEEIATLFGIHKGTVRNWINSGLPILDENRPMLILGEDLRGFLENRRKKSKQPCRPGEIYCVRCRLPRVPLGLIVHYKPMTGALGDIMGRCPECEIAIYRRVNRMKLDYIKGDLRVIFPQGLEHIEGRCAPSRNYDFNPTGETI